MIRYDYTTVQDMLRTLIAAYGAVADDGIRDAGERRQARTDQTAAAAQLQQLRAASDADIERLGREYAPMVAALNR